MTSFVFNFNVSADAHVNDAKHSDEECEFKTYISEMNNIPIDIVKGNSVTNYTPAITLDKSFQTVGAVQGMHVQLRPHQRTAVHAMIELENNTCVTCASTSTRVNYNTAVLSEPVGSGKTFDVLATILLNKTPASNGNSVIVREKRTNNVSTNIQRVFSKNLRCTLVFTGTSVLRQWYDTISVFTTMSVFVIENVRHLRVLWKKIEDGSINDYDIVLVKNGKVTVDPHLPPAYTIQDMECENNEHYIMTLISYVHDVCWNRVVIDDFDTIKLPNRCNVVNARFTWLVSSTRRSIRMDAKSITTLKASNIVKTVSYSLDQLMANGTLYKYFNVRNDPMYIEQESAMPIIKFHQVIFQSPSNTYITLLNGMRSDQITRITEMLNGDALEEAARELKITATSASGIFTHLLGSESEKYRRARAYVDFAAHIVEDIFPVVKYSHDYEYPDKTFEEFEEPSAQNEDVIQTVDRFAHKYDSQAKAAGKELKRVSDNIAHNECPICKCDLKYEDSDDDSEKCFIINKCCGMILHASCGMQANNMMNRASKLVGQCCNCMKVITIKDVIFIKNLLLDDVNEEKMLEDAESTEEELVEVEEKEEPLTKFTALMKIITHQKVKDESRIEMYLPNVMKGSRIMREPSVRKVLIFANFDETLNKVMSILDENHVHYWRLMGTSAEISAAARSFNECEGTCAMIINATRYCQGLNLQTATDLVFMHNIRDKETESQVAGRGHRIGRTSPLNVWYLQYENEHTDNIRVHNPRVMTYEEVARESQYEDVTLEQYSDVTSNIIASSTRYEFNAEIE